MIEQQMKFDIAIVGAGPASIAAACAAAHFGKSVVMLETSPWLGGQLWRSEYPRAKTPQAIKWFTRLSESSAKAFLNTTVIDAPAGKTLLAETSTGNLRIRYDKLIIATGAREIFLPFPGWTLPNVFGAGAMQALAKDEWPVSGKRVAVAGSGPLAFRSCRQSSPQRGKSYPYRRTDRSEEIFTVWYEIAAACTVQDTPGD